MVKVQVGLGPNYHPPFPSPSETPCSDSPHPLGGFVER